MSAETLKNMQLNLVRYDRQYQYPSVYSNKVNRVTDVLSGTSHQFEWESGGNLMRHMNSDQNYDRRLWWTEDNRLQFVKDNGISGAYYQYDAGGDRTYKLLYHKTTGSLNGVQTDYYTLDDATLYVSPYLVVTPQGYTKHYYAENERITTQLGKYRFAVVDSCVAGDSLAPIKLQNAAQAFPTDSFPTPAPMFGYLHSLTNHPNTVSTLYFYHPDHLGSASWITNIYGRTIQHLYYLPWGEDFVNQKTTSFSSMYTFSAKERDSETGLSYFGSRYYSSDLSIWLSVDPMSDKYPSLSPYTYCADNPVKLTDPDGRWIPGLDEDYNITVTKEEGDDFNSFREFMGPGYSDEEIKNMFDDLQGDKINLTKSYGGVFQRMTNALNNAYGDPEFLDADNYNCWGAALNLTSGYELTKRTPYTSGSGIDTEDKFDELLTKFYTQVSPEMASVGKTVLRYGFTPDVAEHAAIYMGKDKSGNEYVFTKNGWRTPPAISTVGNMLAPGGYGVNCSIGSVNDNNCYGNGYYTSKQPKR